MLFYVHNILLYYVATCFDARVWSSDYHTYKCAIVLYVKLYIILLQFHQVYLFVTFVFHTILIIISYLHLLNFFYVSVQGYRIQAVNACLLWLPSPPRKNQYVKLYIILFQLL
jgi:hypothetical protein